MPKQTIDPTLIFIIIIQVAFFCTLISFEIHLNFAWNLKLHIRCCWGISRKQHFFGFFHMIKYKLVFACFSSNSISQYLKSHFAIQLHSNRFNFIYFPTLLLSSCLTSVAWKMLMLPDEFPRNLFEYLLGIMSLCYR